MRRVVRAASWSSLLAWRETRSRSVGEGWSVAAWADGGSEKERCLVAGDLEGVVTSRGDMPCSIAVSIVARGLQRSWLLELGVLAVIK